MDPIQIALVVTGLLIAGGGVLLLVRSLHGRYEGTGTIRPYVPLATLVVGLVIAYRAYVDYSTLDRQDIVIMGLFVFGLLMLLGLQFFVADRYKPRTDGAGEPGTGDNRDQKADGHKGGAP